MAVATEYWNSVTGQWNAASLGGVLPGPGDTVIADGRSQKSFITSLDRTVDAPNINRAANGTFASDTVWTKGTGWAISGGKAQATAGSASDLSQAAILRIGGIFAVTYTVSGRTAGTVTMKCGTAAGTARSTNATFAETLTCTGDTAIYFSKSSDFDGAIDDVLVYDAAGLDLAKFETKEEFAGDVGTPDQPWKGGADLFIHRGRGKLYFQSAGASSQKIDHFILDTPNLSHEVTFGDVKVAGDTRCLIAVILRGRAYYVGNGSGFADHIYIGYHDNAIMDANVRTADGALCRDITQYASRFVYNGQYYDVADRFTMAGGYCQFNGIHAIYVQTGGYVDFGVLTVLGIDIPASLITAYLIGGTLDASNGPAGKVITTAYVSPSFNLVETDKLTIINRTDLGGVMP